MKAKLLFVLFSILIFELNAQVGIGTTDPTKDLDVNGEMRVRNLPDTTNSSNLNIVTTDADGNLGQANIYSILDASSVIATSNVDSTVDGTTTINNIDLGLSVSVTIPANVEALVIINYSVPVGVSSFTDPGGYYGIRFLKDGTEADAGSRKYSCIINTATANVITISNVYTESFASSATDRTIVYTLNGYIEQGGSDTHTYRFNMWSATGDNFNWGKATMTKSVFVR